MKIQNYHFLCLIIALLCDSSFSNSSEEIDDSKPDPDGSETNWEKEVMFDYTDDPEQLNETSTESSLRLYNPSPQNSQIASEDPVNNPSKSLANIFTPQNPVQSRFGQNYTIEKVVPNFRIQNELAQDSVVQEDVQNFIWKNKAEVSPQGSWAVLMNSSNVPVKKIPIQDGSDPSAIMQKVMEDLNLDNQGNGANSYLLEGSYLLLVNSANTTFGHIKIQTEYKINYSMQNVNASAENLVHFPTIQVSAPTSTLTTQITTMIQQSLVPDLLKYLSLIKSEAQGTRADILMVFLPKLVQLTHNLNNLKNQLSISSASSSQQVPEAFISQLTNVLTALQSSVNNIQDVEQKPDGDSKHLTETLLEPLSNIQQNINQLQPVLQVIKPSEAPSPQGVSKNDDSGPSPPNTNKETHRKSSYTPATNPVDELTRLVDHIPEITSSSSTLDDAVTTAQNLNSQLSHLHNLAENADKPKEQQKDIQRAILKVAHNMASLEKGPLKASQDAPKHSDVSVLTFSVQSTLIVLSLMNLFKFYFGDNFPTAKFEDQALNTATVELLENTATNLQLLLPYARELSGETGKTLVPHQEDVKLAFNNVLSSLTVLLPYLVTVTSEVSSGAPNPDESKDLLPTINKVILNFDLAYPFYAKILGKRAQQSLQQLKTNQESYNLVLSVLVHLHNVSLAATEFHQSVWTNIAPKFSTFVHDLITFDLTQLKGPPEPTKLSDNLEELLPDVRKISETKSSSAEVARKAIFAQLRPQLERLLESVNAKSIRSSFSAQKLTKSSTASLEQFSKMYKNLDLLLTYLDDSKSTKLAESGDDFLYTVADFKSSLSQARQVVLDALKKIPEEVGSTTATEVVVELNRLLDNIGPGTPSLEKSVATVENLDSQLSSLCNLVLAENADQPKDQQEDIKRAILKVTLNRGPLIQSPFTASLNSPKYSRVSVLTFATHSSSMNLSLMNLFKFYFGVNFPTVNFDGQPLKNSAFEVLSNINTIVRMLQNYAEDVSQKNKNELSAYQDDVNHAINNVYLSLTVVLPYLRNVTLDLISGAPHPDEHKNLLKTVDQITGAIDRTYPYHAKIIRNSAENDPEKLKKEQDLSKVVSSLLIELYNATLAGTEFHQIVRSKIVPTFVNFVQDLTSFNLTQLKGSPESAHLSDNLQLLLPDLLQLKLNYTTPARIAKSAIFGFFRPHLQRLSQTLNAESIRAGYTVTITKESNTSLTQFSDMFKNLKLILECVAYFDERRLAESLPFRPVDFRFWITETHQAVLDVLKHFKRSTMVTETVEELLRLVDRIPEVASLEDAVTTAQSFDSQLSQLRNLTLTGNEFKPEDQDKIVQGVIVKVTLNVGGLRKSPLQESSDSPKYSGVSVLTFSNHSTQIVVLLVDFFKVYFGVDFATMVFDGQSLNAAAVELLSTTATNLQLLLPYVRDLSGGNNDKALVGYQSDVNQAIGNVFAVLTTLVAFLRLVTSEVASGSSNQPKDLLPTVTNAIINFELIYPYYAQILHNQPQQLKTNQDLHLVALSFLVHLHNVSLAATEFHLTVWTNIETQFATFAQDIISFDFTLTKGPPANLTLLLPHVRRISETKSSSAVVALNAIFALVRPHLTNLSQTLNVKTMRSQFTPAFAKESVVFIAQFCDMFKGLDLLLTYLDVDGSKPSIVSDFLLFTIADFKLWFSQAHQVVLDALEEGETNRRSSTTPLTDAVDELNLLVNHIPDIESLKDAVITAQNLDHQLSYLLGVTKTNKNEQRKLKLEEHEKDIQRVILKVVYKLQILMKSPLGESSDSPDYSNFSVMTFVIYSAKVELSLVNLFVFYFGFRFSYGEVDGQSLNPAAFALLSNSASNLQLLLPYARDLSQKNNTKVWVPQQIDFDNTMNTLVSSFIIQGTYMRMVASKFANNHTHPNLQTDMVVMNNTIINFELIFPYYVMVLRNNRRELPQQQLDENFKQYFFAESMLYELHTTVLASSGFSSTVERLVHEFSVNFMSNALFELKLLNGPPGPINLSNILQYFINSTYTIRQTNPSTADVALDSYFYLLRPYLLSLRQGVSAKKIRQGFSSIKFTHKEAIVSLTRFSNMFKSLDLFLTLLDVYKSTKTVFGDVFPFSLADYKSWFSEAHEVVLEALQNNPVGLRRLPDYEFNSAEKDSSAWTEDLLDY